MREGEGIPVGHHSRACKDSAKNLTESGISGDIVYGCSCATALLKPRTMRNPVSWSFRLTATSPSAYIQSIRRKPETLAKMVSGNKVLLNQNDWVIVDMPLNLQRGWMGSRKRSMMHTTYDSHRMGDLDVTKDLCVTDHHPPHSPSDSILYIMSS